MSTTTLIDKVRYGFGYIVLDITEAVPPLDSLIVDGVEFLSKSEYHCSLVAVKRIAQSLAENNNQVAQLQKTIVENAKKQLAQTPIDTVHFTGQFYRCHKNGESTIIGLVDVPGLQELRQGIASSTGISLDDPLPHVTVLKTINSQWGIAVNAQTDFNAYCSTLPPDIEQALKGKFHAA